MAQTITINLSTVAQTGGITATVNGLRSVRAVTDTLNRTFSTMAARLAGIAAGVVGIHALTRGMKTAVSTGIEFNRTIEDSTIGIAAILRQFQPERFKTFQMAMVESAKAIETLKKRALESPMGFQELVQGFQAISGVAMGAGISLRNQVDLVLTLAQAVKGLGLRPDQFVQEARALLTGKIDRTSTIGMALNLNSAEIEAARESGQLFEFLMGKLSSFSEAARESSRSYTTLVGNLGDVTQQKLGAIVLPLFDSVKASVERLTEAIRTTDLEGIFEGISRKIADAAKNIINFGASLIENLEILRSGRLGEFIGLAIEAGIEESLNRISEKLDAFFTQTVEGDFYASFIIFSEKVAKHLAHALLVAVKVPVDFLATSFEWLAINAGDQFTKMFAAVGRVAMDVFVGSVNVLISALNKVPGFRGKFAALDTSDFGGIDKMLNSLEAGAEGGTFGEMFAAQQEKSAEAIEMVVNWLDKQIVATKQILEQGNAQADQIEQQTSALERLVRLRDEILSQQQARSAGPSQLDDVVVTAEQIERTRTFFQVLRDEIANFRAGFAEAFAELQDEIETVGGAISEVLVNGIRGAIDTVSYGLWAVIDGTATWGDLFRNVARNIISDLIKIMLQEVALDLLKRGLMAAWKAFVSMFRKADVAEANATEAAKTPALAANATLASISSWGLAVVIGIAAIAAILASVGAFQEGGVVKGGEQLIRVNEAGTEAVLNAQATSMLGENTINALNRGVMPEGGIAGAQSLAAAGTPAASSGRPTSLTVAVLDNRDQVRQWAESSAGQMWIIETVKNNRTEIGIP